MNKKLKKQCPLNPQTKCDKNCAWYIEGENNCAIVSIYHVLWDHSNLDKS